MVKLGNLKLIFRGFVILGLIFALLPQNVLAMGDWRDVGNFGNNFDGSMSFTLDNNNVPYVAYSDSVNGSKATVKRFDGTNWVTVGNPGFSAGQASYTSIVVGSNNTPYVSFSDSANSGKVTVMKYDGTNWVTVGNPGFSAGNVYGTSIALDSSNNPFLTYIDYIFINDFYKIEVKNFNGTDWVNVGDVSSFSEASYATLILDNNDVPHIAYSLFNTFTGSVMKYDGVNWESVGFINVSTGLLSSERMSLTFDNNNVPYIAHRDPSPFQNNKVAVRKYENEITDWNLVGFHFSPGPVNYLAIDFDNNNVPYVAFADTTDNSKLTVMKYDESSWTSWSNVGEAGISTGSADNIFLAIDNNNVPYVAYMSDAFFDMGIIKIMKFVVPTLSISPTHTTSEASTSTPISINVVQDQTYISDVTFSLTTSGTAIKDTDYTLDNTIYTIPAGQTSVNILLTPIDNYIDEANKTVNLVLSSTDAFISNTSATSTITITDNDTFGTTSTDNSMIVHKNQTTGVYKVVLNSQPTADVMVVPLTPDGFSVSPTLLTFTSGNWSTPQNITVTLTDPANTNYQTSYITHSITSGDSNYSSHVPANTSITLINVNTSGGGGSSTSGLSSNSSSSSSSSNTTANTTNNPVVPTTPTIPVVQPVTPVTTPQVIKPIVVTPDMPKAWQNIITDGDTVFSINQQPEQTVSQVIQSIITKVLPTTSNIPETTKAQVTTFITQGTNTTKTLGTGERAGVVSSFISAYNKLPSTQTDWQDVIKLANGRWPEQRNQKSEDKAKETFTSIYKRQPSSTNPNDNNAITIMAYGLRPATRNLESEKQAINTFKAINNRLPQTATDWDTIRAIAYSGARR